MLRYVLNSFIFLLITCCCQYVSAQTLAHHSRLIDSLIFSGQFDKALTEADSIINLFPSQPEKADEINIKLTAILQKAEILISQERANKATPYLIEAINLAEKYALPEKAYRAHLIAAIVYEVVLKLAECNEHLDKAYGLYKTYRFQHLFSTYCIRRSSYYRFKGERQPAIDYAQKALAYAKQFHQHKDMADAYLLLGALLKGEEAISYFRLAAHQFISNGNLVGAGLMYNNISNRYMDIRDLSQALIYSDSAIYYHIETGNEPLHLIFLTRSRYYEMWGNIDSAYFYYKKYHNSIIKYNKDHDAKEFKDIEDKYENDKKETIIKTKDQQMLWIGAFLSVIVIAAGLVVRKNRKISAQNKIINKQLAELSTTLAQKKVLLSELQHRVKNNLQHVISILEIQKESVDFNNIEELIRGNQNRVHSLALLHKKLNVDESVNEVNLKKYITELSEIVKESYDDHKKSVSLQVACEIETISIATAMPLGLIIVELVSNSMKHAFKKKNTGIIYIEIKQATKAVKNKLVYIDNGPGFDFANSRSKGLGVEIIKGLIDQLNADVSTGNNTGFELTIHF